MTTATITYRKTKTGEWVAYGPATAICADAEITVTKRDGTTKRELIHSTGKPFVVNGVKMVYGYIAEQARAPKQRGGLCDECGAGAARHHRTDSSGIPGKVCDPCSRQPSYILSFA